MCRHTQRRVIKWPKTSSAQCLRRNSVVRWSPLSERIQPGDTLILDMTSTGIIADSYTRTFGGSLKNHPCYTTTELQPLVRRNDDSMSDLNSAGACWAIERPTAS